MMPSEDNIDKFLKIQNELTRICDYLNRQFSSNMGVEFYTTTLVRVLKDNTNKGKDVKIQLITSLFAKVDLERFLSNNFMNIKIENANSIEKVEITRIKCTTGLSDLLNKLSIQEHSLGILDQLNKITSGNKMTIKLRIKINSVRRQSRFRPELTLER